MFSQRRQRRVCVQLCVYTHSYRYLVFFCVRNGLERFKKAVFALCARNGSVTPREEGFAKQTQVMLLGGWGWSAEDVA